MRPEPIRPSSPRGMDRRTMLGASLGLGLGPLGGCATAPGGPAGLPFYDRLPPLAPFRLHRDRIFDITVCLRPFRDQGPRLDTESVGDTLVVHNYGHGGSGWSLSWGSSTLAVRKALAGGAREVGVIGCGALGLTSALLAQKAGAAVTIYARERMPDVRSARATGSWTPDSRIALQDKAASAFPALWEQMARTAWKEWRGWLGLPGDPVEWTDRYTLSDISPDEMRARRRQASTLHFVEYQPLIRDIVPRAQLLPAGSHPFPTPYVQRNSSLTFNVIPLGHQLITDFLLAGGKIERREFHQPAELAGLKEKVVINCTGYGARALWKDETVRPVRGQIAWLIPQPEVRYGLNYDNVTCLSRRDGIVLQASPVDEAVGIDDVNETPDPAEADAALATIQALYARMGGRRPRGAGGPV